MRLDQLIAAHTPYSRKEVKLLLRQKQIKVNDLIIVKADTKVQPEQDTITIKGEPQQSLSAAQQACRLCLCNRGCTGSNRTGTGAGCPPMQGTFSRRQTGQGL